jgi:hypothetical protein
MALVVGVGSVFRKSEEGKQRRKSKEEQYWLYSESSEASASASASGFWLSLSPFEDNYLRLGELNPFRGQIFVFYRHIDSIHICSTN